MVDEQDSLDDLIAAFHRFVRHRGGQMLNNHLATFLVLASARMGEEINLEIASQDGSILGRVHVEYTEDAVASLRRHNVT